MDNQNFISYRETQKGDWLIFEARPYQQGIGVNKVGAPGDGYTTATQFDRCDTEAEAKEKAIALAADLTDDHTKWSVIPWQPPRKFNPRFIDLPKKYPDRQDYSSFQEAEEDGWIRINPSKTIEYYRGHKIHCADVTIGELNFGYSLAIRVKGNRTDFAESFEVWAGGKFSARFRAGDVVDGILAARKWIDEDLVTQAEAAQIMADLTGNKPFVQAIRNAIDKGLLNSYQNTDISDLQVKRRHGLTLVSRSQVERLWGEK